MLASFGEWDRSEESRAFRKGQGDPFRYVESPMPMALELKKHQSN